MAQRFKFGRSDPLIVFSSAKVSNVADYSYVALDGSVKTGEGLAAIKRGDFEQHIGLRKFIIDNTRTIDTLLLQDTKQGLLKKKSTLLSATEKMHNKLDLVTLSLVQSYISIAGANYAEGGMDVERAHKKAYKMIRPYAEEILNHHMFVSGLLALIKFNNTASLNLGFEAGPANNAPAPAAAPAAAPAPAPAQGDPVVGQ